MYIAFAAYAVVLYGIGVELFWEPTQWKFLVVLAPWAVSLLGMLLVRWILEDMPPNGMFNPKTQSWAFLYGDSIALPLGFLFIVLARDGQVLPEFGETLWWEIAAAVVGLAGGAGFHVMDTGAYKEQGASLALKSPTKIWHDFVVYPVLLGLIVWALGPLLAPSAWSLWTALVFAALAGWLVLGVKYDGARKPRPYDMHPGWDTKQFDVSYD